MKNMKPGFLLSPEGEKILPITHINLVIGEDGISLNKILEDWRTVIEALNGEIGYCVWVGPTPPENKKMLWIDTSEIEENPNDVTTMSPTTRYLIDLVNKQNKTVSMLTERLNVLENELELVKKAIANGGSGGEIIDDNIYLTTEDGDTFITEDGILMISEEGNSNEEGNNNEDKNIYLTTEDNDIFTTENGVSMISEEGKSNADEVDNKTEL